MSKPPTHSHRVACPECGAAAGALCKRRPKGVFKTWCHLARNQKAREPVVVEPPPETLQDFKKRMLEESRVEANARFDAARATPIVVTLTAEEARNIARRGIPT